ncbi:UDP-glucose 4-epimerase GalE [Candidatus Foliamicus sp.]
MRVLITGGAGFIGSHTALELIAARHEPVLLDNLCNASAGVLTALAELSDKDVPFVEGDIRDRHLLDGVFGDGGFEAVIHLAGLKAVGESVEQPLRYYESNVSGSVRLLELMTRHGVKSLVFSSTASLYAGASEPLREDSPIAPLSPYARSKRMVEEILQDLRASDPGWRISILRYFNASGAHPSGLLGESPRGTPKNLLPSIAQVAAGRARLLEIYGSDYPTSDGTCIRDYVHVTDVARAHVKALEALANSSRLLLHNLGTGRGHSTLEVVRAFEHASGRQVPYSLVARRPGDRPFVCADSSRAQEELGWTATQGLDQICEDAWRWNRSHPDGFG